MSNASEYDSLLIERIRAGDDGAWQQLIGSFEGRLLAFVETRLRNRSASEDVVQEAFIGFLTSLPNYDGARPLDSYLFSITAHKLTDHLRREGRRPSIPLSAGATSEGEWELPGRDRAASSIMRSSERRHLEEASLVSAVAEQLRRWKKRGDWQKVQCVELLFVRGLANNQVAKALSISEQTVANHKFDFLAKLKSAVRKQGLSLDIFPELNPS